MMVHCGERFDHGYNTLKKAFDGKKPDESTLNVGGSGGGNWNMDTIEVTERVDTNTTTSAV